MNNNVNHIFKSLGAEFLIPLEEFQKRVDNVNTFVFDWDGVFNNGIKYGNEGSLFSDIDAMGINILRFAYWLKHNKIPDTYILTGMTNNSAKKLAIREHFKGIFMNSKFKINIVDKLCRDNGIDHRNVAFIYDDILDLEVAKRVGLSIRVKRDSSPLFDNFVRDNKIGHYVTYNTGDTNAVREICELLAGNLGYYNNAVEKRMKFEGEYKEYLLIRNSIETKVLELKEPKAEGKNN